MSLLHERHFCTRCHFCKRTLLHGDSFAQGDTFARRHYWKRRVTFAQGDIFARRNYCMGGHFCTECNCCTRGHFCSASHLHGDIFIRRKRLHSVTSCLMLHLYGDNLQRVIFLQKYLCTAKNINNQTILNGA